MASAVTLLQLECFLAAVEHGSFSAAAEALHVAQPSLSEQVRRLEGRLGVTLFVRTNRRLALTEAGQLLLPGARATLAAAETAAEAVRPVRTLTGGTASFGTFSSAHHFLLVELVARFRERFPGVRVRMLGRNSTEVADAVRDGRLEAGLVALPVDTQGLDVTPPAWTVEVVYASADPSRVTGPVSVERLAGVPLVLPEAGWGDLDPTRRQLTERARRAGVTLEPAVEVELPAAAVALAARGVGDVVVSRSLLAATGLADQLHRAPLDPPMYETFAFVTRSGSRLSPATQEMIRMAADLLRRSPA
ncbi:MAG TPA: LysR family transcriptional regulator [Micromonosporaceae bacterium]|nr:LysR family transcriptional regulator [Micromonosporaceae bacterium]